eukprot:6863177-Prymnesium_polylepis.1
MGGHAVVVDGHDTKTRFFDAEPHEIRRRLVGVVEHITEKCGGTAKDRKWVALYGGNPYDPERCDVAHVVRVLHDEFGVPVVATQCDEFESMITT